MCRCVLHNKRGQIIDGRNKLPDDVNVLQTVCLLNRCTPDLIPRLGEKDTRKAGMGTTAIGYWSTSHAPGKFVEGAQRGGTHMYVYEMRVECVDVGKQTPTGGQVCHRFGHLTLVP